MRNSFRKVCQVVCAVTFIILAFEARTFVFAETRTPQVPQASVQNAETAAQESIPAPKEVLNEITQGDDYPVELLIPSIKLDVPVIQVGVNDKGEMDVPDGNTKNVGWYKGGTIPGNTGSAVIDAHVFAAFKNLRYAKVGDDMYVKTRSGKFLHFRVEDSRVYKTAQVPLQKLFNQRDATRLNLITCAGKLLRDGSTYDHRLIVYTKLVDE